MSFSHYFISLNFWFFLYIIIATTDATKTAIISIALTPAFGIAVFAIVESLFCPPTETVTPSVVGWLILGFSLSDGVVGVDGFSGAVGLLGSVGSVGVDDFNFTSICYLLLLQ